MVDEITTRSWGSRLKDAFVGILIGIVLLSAGIVLIFWNEKHSLHTAQSLEQAQKILVSIPSAPVNPKNNLKVVYVNGIATTKDTLSNPQFGVSVVAISLKRSVEMYQWKESVETKKESQMGGSEKEVKSYSYSTTWSETLIDSSNFKTPDGHQNPGAMHIQTKTQYADKVTLGDFTLPYTLSSLMDVSQPVALNKVNKEALGKELNKPVHLVDNVLYLGQDPNNPQPGDLRIKMSAIMPQDVSIIAQQTENTFQAYMAPAGESVLLLEPGRPSAQLMMENAQSENRMIAWIIRLASLLMLIGGFALIFNPLVVLADVLPFLGSIIGFGTGFLAILLGSALWIIITATAWFTTRPLWSIGLIVILIVGGFFMIRSKRNKSRRSKFLRNNF